MSSENGNFCDASSLTGSTVRGRPEAGMDSLFSGNPGPVCPRGLGYSRFSDPA